MHSKRLFSHVTAAPPPQCSVFTSCMYSSTELQLAALLGKTLLEKNGELELKLKRLQDFAEETLVANQVSAAIMS